VKTLPKVKPTHILSKLMHKLYRLEKSCLKSGLLFSQKTTQSKQSLVTLVCRIVSCLHKICFYVCRQPFRPSYELHFHRTYVHRTNKTQICCETQICRNNSYLYRTRYGATCIHAYMYTYIQRKKRKKLHVML
jgi:hypothetical protein